MIESHEDYEPVPPSPRHQAANDLAWMLRDCGLRTEFNKEPYLSPDHRCRIVDFINDHCKGTVGVFNTNYLAVQWRGTADVLQGETRVYESVEEAFSFIVLAFVNLDRRSALAVPVKAPKADNSAEAKS